jgi:hypothetical protein
MVRVASISVVLVAFANALIVALFGAFGMGVAVAEPSVYPVGVTLYDPGLAYNCYVLFRAPDRKTRLIDMDGSVIHTWAYVGFPSQMISPAVMQGVRGDIFVQVGKVTEEPAGLVPDNSVGFEDKTVDIADWNNKIVWAWGRAAPDGAAHQHHDQQRLSGGNTLILSQWYHHVDGFTLPKVLDDVIYEIGPNGGIVWRWVASAHLRQLGFTRTELRLIHASHTPDYFHINAMQTLGQNKWFAAGDQRFAPSNIIISSREANFVAIVDKRTGKIVWEIGPHFVGVGPGHRVDRSGLTNDEMAGQHDAHMIPADLPGGGDILVFDDQGEAGYPPVTLGVMVGSRILEINPETKRVVWSYSAIDSGEPTWTFYSSFMGSAQRLPNGNTLIDEAMTGRFFQVTPSGKIVWEYVSPYFSKANIWGVNRGVLSNYSYRAQAVPYDWVPSGTPHSENPVGPAKNSSWRDH